MPRVVPASYAVRYDGTNGEYIAGTWCTGITFVSDTGSVFTYTSYSGNQEVNLGEWVLVAFPSSVSAQVISQEQYAARYAELP